MKHHLSTNGKSLHAYSVTYIQFNCIMLSLYDQWHLMNVCPRFVKMTLNLIECLAFKLLRDPPHHKDPWFIVFPYPILEDMFIKKTNYGSF